MNVKCVIMLAQNKLLSYLCNVRNKQITILKGGCHTETTTKRYE
uniref:Uncharacterized protein n=2 Tax=unclassified Caudoviricetes TaxID=2788787 RepID=A0A8S5NA35_9CAUD|nr:MAG TPA: hypothetical protein [Siphoviridae sp. ctCOj19]DAD91637.1 MAG TPA: hypothetical protein [Siphoviridae sp. ctjd446]